MDIHVLNKRTLADPLPGVYRVYVGRPSVLGNPFPMRSESDRDDVCERYLAWLRENYRAGGPVRAELERLYAIALEQPLELVCFCAPRRCHADSIKQALLGMRSQRI